MKVIVIGGDAAGMSAASKLKRVEKDSEITVYEKGTYLSYAACGLPYFAAHPEIGKEDLIQRTKDEFEAQGIRPLLRHEAIRVMPAEKAVLIRNLDTGEEFRDTYDRLLIAAGAHPVIPPVPGAGLRGVQALKTVDDGVALKEQVSRAEVGDITIVGGGYIGVEAAESLLSLGKKVRIIQMPDRLLRNFDPEISDFARKELERLGAEVKTVERMEAILGTDRAETVVTDKGSYPTDLVLLAIGVMPATEFLRDSGIELAGNGAVVVDREMRTNFPDIYAAGDCAEVYHLVKEKNAYIPLATTANKCGRIAGENLAGGHVSFVGTLGSAAVKIGELEFAGTGLSQNEANEMGLDFKSVLVKTYDKPHYYPGATPIWFKLLYENGTGRILGVQGAGQQGVVLRIDIFAAAIANRMSVEELGMLDLCYAPPFSTPWDAVHIAANAAK